MTATKRMMTVLTLIAGIFFASPALFADVGSDADPAAPPESVVRQESVAAAIPVSQPQAAVVNEPPTSVEVSATAPAPAGNTNPYQFPKVMTPQDEEMARKFEWWPSDAKPGPYKDTDRSGYWWWPEIPGEHRPWGNQGYIYVRKIIFDYKTTEGPMKPSLIIKRILKNVKIYFDYDKADLRDDARAVLDQGLYTLEKNPKADILITGNADTRGSEQYNQKLGERRAASVQQYLTDKGLPAQRIRILSRGKLDAMASVKDLVGMQKDRNAQFMIAEVEEVMIPADKAAFFQDKVVEERREVESQVKVSVKEYVIQKGDTLWKIAEKEYGDGKQWKRIYSFNQDVIANPDRPKKGTRIKIPIE
ncbi:MAG: OmpA family protein [Candidatus Omnitrophota bacterium]